MLVEECRGNLVERLDLEFGLITRVRNCFVGHIEVGSSIDFEDKV